MSLDTGLLILRLVLGFILFAHAMQKAAGWFSGPGMEKATLIFAGLGQQPARPMVVLAVACELVAGLLLALGVGTVLGAAIGCGTMLVAGAAMSAKARTFWNSAGGGEYPFALAVGAAVLGFTGPGRFSVDEVLDLPLTPPGVGVGWAVIIIAVLAAAVPTVRTRRALTSAR